MNLLLFEPAEAASPLPRTDPRAEHLLRVLGRAIGDTFDAGLVNGPRGKGTLAEIGPHALTLTFAWGETPPPPAPLTLIVGLPRPQTARDILRDVTTLGVAAFHFVITDKGERNYAQSQLWHSGEWRRRLWDGTVQAFDTHLPSLTQGHTLDAALAALPAAATRLALDNYESPAALSACAVEPAASVILAIGPERGWSARERDLLRATGFTLAHLGPRVLRTETACLAAVTLVRAKLGLL